MAEVEGVATASTPKASEGRQIAYPQSLGTDRALLVEGRGRDELARPLLLLADSVAHTGEVTLTIGKRPGL